MLASATSRVPHTPLACRARAPPRLCTSPPVAAAAAAAPCRAAPALVPSSQAAAAATLPPLRRRRRQHLQRRQHVQPVAALPEALAALEASPARDVAAAAFAVAGSVGLIKFFDALEGAGVIDKARWAGFCSLWGLAMSSCCVAVHRGLPGAVLAGMERT